MLYDPNHERSECCCRGGCAYVVKGMIVFQNGILNAGLSLYATRPKSIRPAQRGSSKQLPADLASWIASGGLLQLHTAALQQPNVMLSAAAADDDFSIGRDVDFGVHQLLPAPSNSKHDQVCSMRSVDDLSVSST